MDCTNCHDQLMKKSVVRESPTAICSSCHEDVLARFDLNERHRLQEGILECTSCHDPHAPAARERLGGFKHESCLRCHTDKGGPYFYEHEASRLEGCNACHEVHGTPNRHLLTHQSASDLCFSCHTRAVSWHSRFTSESTNCTVCHSTIHGSNLSKRFLK
jgi:DmsE family decaheme c-type cytochrome